MSNVLSRGALARAALVAASAALTQVALADGDTLGRCVDGSAPKKQIAELGGKWTELTRDEWQFLRGIYAMNPATPAGLPYGDEAALAEIPGRDGGMVFFLDGERACTPMVVPGELLTMMRDVAAKTIPHEGNGT